MTNDSLTYRDTFALAGVIGRDALPPYLDAARRSWAELEQYCSRQVASADMREHTALAIGQIRYGWTLR